MFTQNVLKSHNKFVKYMNQKNQNLENVPAMSEENNLSRSKSEIDILHSNFALVTKEMNEISSNHGKKSNGSSTMFGFFNRKKNHEMNKSSTMIAQKPASRESEKRENADTVSHNLHSRTKKRQAPAAPAVVAQVKVAQEAPKSKPVDQPVPRPETEAKKEPVNGTATSIDVDQILIEKLLKNTKKKKKAPLPPAPVVQSTEPAVNVKDLHQSKDDRISIDSPQSIYKEMRSANLDGAKLIESSSPISMNSSPSRSDKFLPPSPASSKELTSSSKQNEIKSNKYSPKHDSPLNISSMSSAEGSIGNENMDTIQSNKQSKCHRRSSRFLLLVKALWSFDKLKVKK